MAAVKASVRKCRRQWSADITARVGSGIPVALIGLPYMRGKPTNLDAMGCFVTQDFDSVLASGEEALMAAQRGGVGGSMQDDGYGYGGDAVHLPQLGNVLPDRTELQLQELRKFKVGAGRVRGGRGVAGQGVAIHANANGVRSGGGGLAAEGSWGRARCGAEQGTELPTLPCHRLPATSAAHAPCHT